MNPDSPRSAAVAPGDLAEESVAARIRERMGDCSPAERKVARTLLAAYPVAGFETVAGLAELAAVSGATVVRFATRLGYRGFPDFQRALRHELEQRSASPASLYERIGAAGASASSDLASLGDAPADDVRATFAGLSEHDFATTVDAIANPKHRVWLAGGRYSGFLAEYLQASLQQLRPAVQMVPRMASLRAATMSGFDAKDVLVVFDFRRYEAETRRLVQHAKARKATVVLVTDRWVSPCAGDADTVLSSLASERGPFDSVVPVMALIEAIFEAVLTRLGPPARERMERIERTVQELELL
ncbi:MurR/RpiR family transcriptional regulator [Agromyces mediolanus]|jgi:DNA-binding MurR/RpiR family transcriptional regulator|uniref:RpiR family transcriptional regulator n=1 Tax=Agromyces mediolanus TaxID=41986 RepID=A0A918F9I3_AGRME|nr:MurR/RpiR family transcriptional regulator [Agromyces mediolanus]GGR13217.1 RpiR family transcriptional regulator [Agromyces mediolanus]GLJ72623.1 RpiR family transcriptional regulator [Agromyces mediolanus]